MNLSDLECIHRTKNARGSHGITARKSHTKIKPNDPPQNRERKNHLPPNKTMNNPNQRQKTEIEWVENNLYMQEGKSEKNNPLNNRQTPTYALLTPVTEPVFIVRGKGFCMNEFLQRPKIQQYMNQSRDFFEVGNSICEVIYGRDAVFNNTPITFAPSTDKRTDGEVSKRPLKVVGRSPGSSSERSSITFSHISQPEFELTH